MSRAQLVAGAPIALAVSRFRFAKLRRVRPRPYALSELQPEMPRILWSEGYGQGLTEIVLAYGHPHDVSKQLIQVQTCFSDEDCCSPSLEEAIARAEHRDACFARLEWMEAGDSFDPFPELPVPYRNLDHNERILAVDGEERTGTVVSHGDYAALRFRRGPVVVTAVARLGFPPVLSFCVIDDLEPYFAGYRRFVLGFLRLLSSAVNECVTCISQRQTGRLPRGSFRLACKRRTTILNRERPENYPATIHTERRLPERAREGSGCSA